MDKENFRAYIKVRTALSIQPKTIHDELYSVFGDQAPSYGTVAKWSKWFREGRETIEDHPRPGRPVTETTSENIEEIRSLINDDPHLTIDEIQVETGMSRGTIERIISNHLQLKKSLLDGCPMFLPIINDPNEFGSARTIWKNLIKEHGDCVM